MRKLSQEQIEQAQYYYDKGILTIYEIARHYGVSDDTVRKYLKLRPKGLTDKQIIAKYKKWG